MTRRDRAIGALYGLAIGDALGMPTQLMSRTGITERYGVIDRFRAADAWHPLAGGLLARHITDDTEQALLLARLLIEGHGQVAPGIFARALVEWEDDMRARGSLDLLGPSTKRAVQAVLDGEPLATAGRFGTTNGAAMRVTPVGNLRMWQPVDIFVDLVAETSFVPHNTGVAIAGAAAVAAAVSAGINGANLEGAVEAAVEAAQIAATRGATGSPQRTSPAASVSRSTSPTPPMSTEASPVSMRSSARVSRRRNPFRPCSESSPLFRMTRGVPSAPLPRLAVIATLSRRWPGRSGGRCTARLASRQRRGRPWPP